VRVSGKRVLITGGASGVGEAAARRFHAEGATVMLVDRDADRGETIAAELGAGAWFRQADVTVEAEIEASVAAAVATLGGLDVLHNNAGMAVVGSALDTEVADWNRVHDLNLKAPWLWSKEVIPQLIKAGGGAIVFTGSTSGMVGYPGVIAYTSSKGGLMNLTRSLALELAERNITVNTVSPGHLDTPMTRAFMTDPADPAALARNLAAHAQTVPIKRLGLPEEVAAFIVFLASDDARFCTGGIYPCDGGVTAE
jgi:NAD(P)-dependent dehydrogenase (short-subunit alcohol dehydrogenase family)